MLNVALILTLIVSLVTPLAAQTADSAAVAALAGDPAAPLPFDPRARMRQLPNGLRYYIRANSRPAARVELRLVVNVGSVLEDDDQRGLAHVLEHMAFNGTRRFAKQQIVDFIERAGMKFGADLNAGTGFDETIYQLQLPADTGNYLGRALDWFADIAGGGIALDSAELAKERPVVIEEWRLGRGASERIQEKQLPFLFRNSPYATRVPIGTKESLDGFTRAELLRFYRDWYRPDLMAVVVVGDIDPDSVESMIVARFGAIAPAPPSARRRDLGPVPGHAETLVGAAADAEASSSTVGVLWKQPIAPRVSVGDYRRELTAALFLAMLNDRYQEIIRKPSAPFIDAGASQGRLVRGLEMFSLTAVVDDGGIERGLSALLNEAERARRFGFTAAELDRVKANVLRSMEIQYAERDKTESNAFAARYADHFLTGEQIVGIETRAPLVKALLPAVGLAEVNALAQAWLTDANRVILASAPAKPNRPMPSDSALRAIANNVRNAALTAYKDTAPSGTLVDALPSPGRIVSEREIPAIGVTAWTLSNGVRVFVKQTDFSADQVLISGVSLGGVSGETPERYYSARLAPLILERGGAGTMNAETLEKALTGKRAAVSADIADRHESFGGEASPRDLDAFFELLWAKAMTPRVDTSAFRAFREQYRAMMRDRENNPIATYFDTIGETMSQHHPLAKPVTDSIIRTLSAQIALDVHRDRFGDFSDFTFVIVGAVSPREVRPLVERWLGALPSGGRVETPRDAGIRPPTGVISKTVRKGVDQKAQTTIILSGETPWSREAAMRAAAISSIVAIRMRETLREDLGGTYGVMLGVSVDRWPAGRFTASVAFGSDPARIDSLAGVALSVFRGFAQNGPTDAELAKVRESLIRERETALRTNDFWLDLLQGEALWGDDPAESVSSYTSRVRALDAAGIQALARVVFNETNMARFTLIPEKTGRTP